MLYVRRGANVPVMAEQPWTLMIFTTVIAVQLHIGRVCVYITKQTKDTACQESRLVIHNA